NVLVTQNNGDYLLDIGCMIGERKYYPWLHYGDYDRYYFSTCDGARCSLHDIYVEVVIPMCKLETSLLYDVGLAGSRLIVDTRLSRLDFLITTLIRDFFILDSEHSTVTYTSISTDDGSLDVGSLGVIPLPAAVSPTTDSSGYITEFDPEEDLKEDDEDPEEDPADYPTDRDYDE
ncbi:hypothetical protein Tco_0375677, partial [Tanacetum coccineum]